MSTLEALFLPHRRAERLIDQKIDEARGESVLAPQDATWLDRHLGGCARCQAVEAQRQDMLRSMNAMRATAPQGFAGRVLMAAKAGREGPALDAGFDAQVRAEAEAAPTWRSQFAVGGAVLALCLGVLASVATIGGGPSTDGIGAVNISGQSGIAQEKPHFSVRAPGMGAAQVRAKAMQILDAHGGHYELQEGALIAQIPRAELLAVMKQLSKQGTFKVVKLSEALDPQLEMIVLRFDLD